ncbi:MAG: SDR family NAD(P)-dependent oxidoreductase [Arthrobacter sp.]|uniref:SDR family NAD(P)-dependent oxidoreductase n=1 Tax=Arthrobacter sp. TaxID=1667 RepID=UPI00349AC812
MTSLDGLTVLVAGATSTSGVAAAHALHDAGATVLAAGTDAGRLGERLPFAAGRYAADLADPAAVAGLAARIRGEHGRLDGLVHLVGGWRGGRGLTGQTDEDWDFLHRNVLTTLRNTSRAFYDDLAASDRGRLAIVSATAVENPTASGANYAAAKSAAETWTRAVAAGFRSAQSGRKDGPLPQRSAAVVLVIKAFVDAAARRAAPGKEFAGFTDVEDFASAVVRLFAQDAAALNGARISLVPGTDPAPTR